MSGYVNYGNLNLLGGPPGIPNSHGGVSFPGARLTRRVPSWHLTKRKHKEILEGVAQERRAAAAATAKEESRRASLTRVQRVNEDLAALDSATPSLSREYIEAQSKREELVKEKAAAEREQTIRELADQIIARRKRT